MVGKQRESRRRSRSSMETASGMLYHRRVAIVLGIVLVIGMNNVLYGREVTSNYLMFARNDPPANKSNKEEKLNLTNQKLANVHHDEITYSPVCKPHFQAANGPNQQLQWSNISTFKRLYFYHVRKAGGTSIKYYMEKVARHHGLQFVSDEFYGSEVPGSHSVPTFYVTHLREPVDRSISHFKYEGRWGCKQLTTNATKYKASEDNANKLESWNGDEPCWQSKQKRFFLAKCAVNCYTQWFSSLSCPSWNIPLNVQAEKARAVLHRFNAILILEKFKDPQYVSAIEDFFGVPGLAVQKRAWCEPESHKVNKQFPLDVKNETLQRLMMQNQIDIDLYKNLSSCLVDGVYNFPKWNADRFASNDTIRVNHEKFSDWKSDEKRKNRMQRNNDPISLEGSVKDTKPSPACNPHFNLVTSHGWSNETKFKRLYFYHSRKAGGSSLRHYLEKVARHHGLQYTVVEYEKAEYPGSYDDATLYVTNIREPVSRSISGFKYEGRWECNQMIYNYSFVPTEANANAIETWIHTGGHQPMKCKFKGNNNPRLFFLGGCAFNCYIQWFAGICPNESVPWPRKYKIAEEKLRRYNLIVVLEKLKDPNYVSAIENFFAVPGLMKKTKSLCEPEADKANKKYPLVIQNNTLAKLQNLNKFDTMLYQSLTECMENGQYDFPRWDESRFYTNTSIQVPHSKFESWAKDMRDKARAIKRGEMNTTLT